MSEQRNGNGRIGWLITGLVFGILGVGLLGFGIFGSGSARAAVPFLVMAVALFSFTAWDRRES